MTLPLVLAVCIALMGASAGAKAKSTPPKPIEIRPVTMLVGTLPISAVSASGFVWVNNHRYPAIWRIDPKTNTAQFINMPEKLCGNPTPGADGVVWFSNCTFGSPSRSFAVDPASGNVVAEVPGAAATYAGGSIWTIDNANAANVMVRRDAHTGAEQAQVRLEFPVGEDGAWPGSECEGALWTIAGQVVQRTDLTTNETRVYSLNEEARVWTDGRVFGANMVGCAAGKVWVPTRAGLFRIDPQTDTVEHLPVKFSGFSTWGDENIASVGHDLFMRTSDTSVARIDARTGKVVARYPASGGGGGVTVGYHSLWIVNADDGSVWRYRL